MVERHPYAVVERTYAVTVTTSYEAQVSPEDVVAVLTHSFRHVDGVISFEAEELWTLED